ncbi:hypothetical protein [Roseimaritima sediminicola]|uniref:hypothetical protein n=1 Tax=Roseimaritima sediminicola TaxID=2662066 RepID=UPI0012982B89|nr:hypothetical protein [Roseimaritima sediminicola]
MTTTLKRRRGILLISVLLALAIVTTLVFLAVRTGLQTRRQMRREVQMEQTRWLLDAGIARGLRELRQSPEYRGETWQVAPVPPPYRFASVTIEVRPAADDDNPPAATHLRVTAVVSATDAPVPLHTTRRSHTVLLAQPSSLPDDETLP